MIELLVGIEPFWYSIGGLLQLTSSAGETTLLIRTQYDQHRFLGLRLQLSSNKGKKYNGEK